MGVVTRAGLAGVDASILGWALMVLFLINLRHFTLPRLLSLPLIALGLAVAWFAAPETFADHLIGAVAGFAAGAMVGVLDRRLDGRLGMGMDGAILLAAAGGLARPGRACPTSRPPPRSRRS